MRVDVYAIDMTGMGCEAAVVARPGGDRTVMMLEQSVSLDRADELMAEYLTPPEQAAAVLHCSCDAPSPHSTTSHGGALLGAWHMASA